MIASTKPAISRPWRRLHVSTWIVALLLACIFTIVIFAGERKVGCEHGWPFRFLQRAQYAEPLNPPSEPLSLWSWRDHVVAFDATALAIDISIGVAALVMLIAIVEFRRRRRGRFWQITLREAFAISMVFAIASAWAGRSLQLTRRQQLAADKITKAFSSRGDDGSLMIDWEKRGCWFFELFTKRGEAPAWFGNVVGIRTYSSVDGVGEFGDELDQFPQLRFLHLSGYGSSADEYQRLQGFQQLQYLSLEDGELTDDAMKCIGSLKRLEVLNLSSNDITDEGLKHLHGLKQLELLEIANNPITDQGVEALQRAIPGLEVWDD